MIRLVCVLVAAFLVSPLVGSASAGGNPNVLAAASEDGPGRAFEKEFQSGNLKFHVACPNDSSIGVLTITIEGLENGPFKFTREVDGIVTGAQVADLDGNGWPELYVFVTSAGSGAYGSVVAYAVNRGKSATPIYMAPLKETPGASAGYMGHDRFAITGDRLTRSFPVYKEGDPNCCPTGGERKVHYRLHAGEAGWQLKVDGISQ